MNSAGSIKFLYAAYTATWLIHVFYIGSLVRRYRRLRRQMSFTSAHSESKMLK
jgi:CcmD family protein